MGNFSFISSELQGLTLIKTKIFADQRGYFMESWSGKHFDDAGIHCSFVQDNQSQSDKDCLRGLHYQKEPYAQDKLVRVLFGEILDVAVDIRPDSPTFLQWRSFILNEQKAEQLFIPKGFAHGFLVLSKKAVVAYKASAFYAPEHDRGIRWNDNEINIDWGIKSPILSEKDAAQPHIKEGALDV